MRDSDAICSAVAAAGSMFLRLSMVLPTLLGNGVWKMQSRRHAAVLPRLARVALMWTTIYPLGACSTSETVEMHQPDALEREIREVLSHPGSQELIAWREILAVQQLEIWSFALELEEVSRVLLHPDFDQGAKLRACTKLDSLADDAARLLPNVPVLVSAPEVPTRMRVFLFEAIVWQRDVLEDAEAVRDMMIAAKDLAREIRSPEPDQRVIDRLHSALFEAHALVGVGILGRDPSGGPARMIWPADGGDPEQPRIGPRSLVPQ